MKRLLFLLLLSVAALSAAPKPDFSGTWKLNLEKSQMGGMPVTELVAQIQHKDPDFKYKAKGVADGHSFEEEIVLTTDGKPHPGPRDATLTAHWDGTVIVIEATSSDGNSTQISRLALSGDGKTLTHDSVSEGDEDRPPRHEVFERQ